MGTRWGLLALPLLVGALLLMHGLDTGGAETGSGRAAPVAQGHDDTGADGHDDGHCPGCDVGHLLAACVAVLATVASVIATRRFHLRSAVIRALKSALRRTRPWRVLLRPPKPAWVRLEVMQC